MTAPKNGRKKTMTSQRHFKVGFLSSEYGNDIKSYLEKENDFHIRLFVLLSEVMHFSLQGVSTNMGGALLPNGTWTGVIGMLNRSEIDISSALLFLDEKRNEAAHFVYPYDISEVTFFFRKPRYSSHVFAIFQTVSKSVWMSIVAAIIVMVVLHFIKMKRRYSLDTILLHVLAMLLRQQPILHSSAMEENILIFSWVFGAFFLSSSYNSVLLSFLSFPPTVSIRNLEALAKAVQEGHYSCTMQQGTSLPDMFAHSENRYLSIIGKSMQKDTSSRMDLEDFIKLNIENTAYLESRDDILFLDENYFISNDQLYISPDSMATKKDFCCKEELAKNIRRIVEAGIIKKFKNEQNFKRAWEKNSNTNNVANTDHSLRKLNLTDVSAAFIFLVIGHVLSLLLLVIEIFVNRRNHRRKRLR